MGERAEVSTHHHVDARGPDGACVVVLQHGFAGSARNWRAQQRALGDRARLVAFDARGHARTARGFAPARYRMADFVRDFGDVARQASPSAPVVAGGISLGAAVALQFALAEPGRVCGLGLAAPPAADGVSAQATDFADAIDRDGLDAAGARFVWGPPGQARTRDAELVRQGFLEHPPEALSAILRQTLAELPTAASLDGSLRALDIPVLIVVGEEDRGSVRSAGELAERLPRAHCVEIPGAGHVVNLAAPAAFNRALEEFLAEQGWV